MFPGFEFNQNPKQQNVDNAQKRLNEGAKPFGASSDHKHIYNFKAPPFEETTEGFSIPPQILELFDSKDKAILENKNKGQSRTSVTSHSTVDSRVGAKNFGGQNFGGMNPSGAPGMNMGQNNTGNVPSFNTLLNQSHDFEGLRNTVGDLNTSNLSQNMSLNNISRDSNQNTSRKNTSSRANPKTSKNYQVTLNEDISLIERIEIMLNQITMNHNKTCPFCSKTIDIKKCNFQNISAFLSNSSKKYYLTHFDCYLKSNSNPASAKIVPLSAVVEAKVNLQINSLHTIDTSNFLRSDRRAYFVSLEGYHPISSYLFFKIDKICHGLEHATHRNQLLYLNLANKSTSIFEPASYMIPFSEFKLTVTIHFSHGNEDPYTYEYLVDFSQAKVSAEQKSRYAEVICSQEGNSINIGTQIVYDPNAELATKASLDTSFQSTGSATASKPDFGKNVFIVLKQFTISLPLRRIERKPKEAQAITTPIVEEAHFAQQQKPMNPMMAPQKKLHSRLQLNPNAPLFGSAGQLEQQGAQQAGHFAPQSSESNMYFAAQGFHQNQPLEQQNQFQDFNFASGFPRGQGQQQHQAQYQPQQQKMMQQQQQQSGHEEMMPPGLGLMGQGTRGQMNFMNFPQQMFQGQQAGDMGMKSGGMQFQNQRFEEQQPQNKLPSDMGFQREYGQEEVTYQNPDTYQPDMSKAPSSLMERGRGNRPASLYTAVLSGRKREDSASNSPSLHNMQNRYFSAASTPTSEYDQAANTPLGQTNNDFLEGGEEESNAPVSEEMIQNFRLDDHLGGLVEFAKTYNGSRILQKFFPTATQDQVELVIREIEGKLEELMLDPYANYMFQTLAQSCSSDQRYFLLKKISPSMVEIACDRKGTHALQALIALINRDVEEDLLRDTLKDHIVELSFDPQGTHLIQKLIVSISLNNISFVFEPLVRRFVEVANHSFGLCVLKQLITKIDKAPELKRRIIKLLFDNFENLVQNPYGNYALQHALDTYQNDCSMIYSKTFDRIVQYSNQKFSSNVIEKCLVIASPEYKKAFVKELARNDRIVELMKNKYGNFVLLKALKSVDADERQIIMQSIMRNLNSVSMAKYKNSWTKFIEENPLRVPGVSQPVKHSIFKQNSNTQFENSGSVESPKPLEAWNTNIMREGEFNQEERGLKENMQGGFREGQMQAGNKKAANQKFYDDRNQHYQNKWGFNNFY